MPSQLLLQDSFDQTTARSGKPETNSRWPFMPDGGRKSNMHVPLYASLFAVDTPNSGEGMSRMRTDYSPAAQARFP